jgi:glutamate 5-kinase
MRIVVKVGSSSLTDVHGGLRREMVADVSAQIVAATDAGNEVVLVTSGAVAAGVGALSLPRRPTDVLALQALAAIGQPLLMSAYNEFLGARGRIASQVLLVANDFVDRTQYLHARDTIGQLLEFGTIPVVNENDAIANAEIRYGDNDHLSALVAHMVGADLLMLLTDTAGLYTADPRHDPAATLVRRVGADDPLLSVAAEGTGTDRGSGGMASKLAAARIASWSGVEVLIASAAESDVVARGIAGDPELGTRFEAHDRQLSAKKLWIAFAADVCGSVTIDDGASRAIRTRGTSLLPAGMTSAEGHFEAGDVVEIRDSSGRIVGRGRSAVSSGEAAAIAGLRSTELDPGHVSLRGSVVVHRDDLVVLSG